MCYSEYQFRAIASFFFAVVSWRKLSILSMAGFIHSGSLYTLSSLLTELENTSNVHLTKIRQISTDFISQTPVAMATGCRY